MVISVWLRRNSAVSVLPSRWRTSARGFGGPNVKSGIRTKGLEKFSEQFQRDIGDENLALQEELNNIAMLEAGGQADVDNYLNQLRLDKQRQIIESAAALQRYSGY